MSASDDTQKFADIQHNVAKRARRHDLYARLAQDLQHDDEIMRLLMAAREPQYANLLFVIVHYLLLRGTQHPLRAYYGSLTETPRPPEDMYAHFRDFCHAHKDTIRQLAATSWVQINYVGRCTSVLPIFTLIAQRLDGAPFALLDVGSSAGFLLLWNQYSYAYSDHPLLKGQSEVTLPCEIRGDYAPPLTERMPLMGAALGMDINPVDVSDEAQRLWLLANFQPTLTDLFQLQKQALEVARQHPPRIMEGDAARDVGRVAAQLPEALPLVILAAYIPEQARLAVLQQARQLAGTRRVFCVTLAVDAGQIAAKMIDYQAASDHESLLAKPDPLGRNLTWLDAATAARHG